MGHTEDRWWRALPAGTKIERDRIGVGLRWRARHRDADGRHRAQSFARRNDAERFLALVLLDAALEAVQFVLAQHREDDADLDGVELLIKRVLRAQRDVNPSLRLLGTVAFARDPRASARNKATEQDVLALLEGSGVQPFTSSIRHAPAAARDSRASNLTLQELLKAAEQASSERISMLRRRAKATKVGKHAAPTERSLWARPDAVEALAMDYLAVLREVTARMNANGQQSAPGLTPAAS